MRWSLTAYDEDGKVVEDFTRPVAESVDHALREIEKDQRVQRVWVTGRGGALLLERYQRMRGILCRME